jgi:hypothetical protein
MSSETSSFVLPIAVVTGVAPGRGRIGFAPYPGRGPGGLDADLATIRAWGAAALLTLVEPAELVGLGLADLGRRARALGLDWYHLPIQDFGAPDPVFEASWRSLGPILMGHLAAGRSVLIHCRGGLGRSGMIAARLLVEQGMAPEQAIRHVRLARPGAIETAAQEAHVRACAGAASAMGRDRVSADDLAAVPPPPGRDEVTVAVTRGVGRALGDLGYGVLTEVALASGRRADVMAIDRAGQVVIVEVKSSIEDFRVDQKWPEYREWCDQLFFAVAEDFPRDILPAEAGLMVADRFGAAILRPAPVLALAAARRRALLLRFALAASTRLWRVVDPGV